MFVQESDGSVEKELKLLVRKKHFKLTAADWQQLQPLAIPSVGLPDIKWKELHSKWGKYVPEDKKQQWRYYNEAPPKEKIAAVAKHSKDARLQRKDQTRTVHDDKPPAKKPKLDSGKGSEGTDNSKGVI
jgi:hypothetical protein